VVPVRESRIDTGSYTQGNKSIDRQMELQDSEEAEDEMKEWPLLMKERSHGNFRSLAGEAEARTISYWPPGSIHAVFHIIF
jgi:hypothetical protein